MTSDAEIGRLAIAEAQACAAVQARLDNYDRTRDRNLLAGDFEALHAAWMQARAECRAAVLERLETLEGTP